MTDYVRWDLRADLLATVQAQRAETGWNQAVLADRAGISQAQLSRLVSGERTGTLPVWQALLDALDPAWRHLDAEGYKRRRAAYRLAPASHS